MRATDDDTGANGNVVYSIFNGENSKASEIFDVDPESGAIAVKESLENSGNTSCKPEGFESLLTQTGLHGFCPNFLGVKLISVC